MRFAPESMAPVPEDDQWPEFGYSPIVSPEYVFGTVRLQQGQFFPTVLVAFDRATGREAWQAEVGGHNWAQVGAPIYRDGTIYTRAGAVDAETGAVVWQSGVSQEDGPSALYDDILVISGQKFPSRDRPGLTALDAETGEVRWRRDNLLETSAYPSPVTTGDGRFYYFGVEPDLSETEQINSAAADTYPFKLYARDPGTGEPVWTFTMEFDEDFYTSSHIVFSNGILYFSISEGAELTHFFAVVAEDGSILWQTDLATKGEVTSLTVGSESIFAASRYSRTYLTSLRKSDGSFRWSSDGESVLSGSDRPLTDTRYIGDSRHAGYSSPVLADGVVYVCTGAKESTIAAMDATTGEGLWEFSAEHMGSGLALAGTELYAYGTDGAIYGITP